MGAYIDVPRQRNSTYAQTVKRSIYKTISLGHPHSPIHRYERRPQGTTSRNCYRPLLRLPESVAIRFVAVWYIGLSMINILDLGVCVLELPLELAWVLALVHQGIPPLERGAADHRCCHISFTDLLFCGKITGKN